jgi:hypothetical protein
VSLLQLAAEKKTQQTVHLKKIFGPSYFEAALVESKMLELRASFSVASAHLQTAG